MKTQDARTLSIKEQELLRRRVVFLVEEEGITVTGAAKAVGVNRKTATRWLKAYRAGPDKGKLTQSRRGRSKGAFRRLAARQEEEIKKEICAGVPSEAGIESHALWTRDAIALLIKKRYRITLPIRTMGHYLKRWGFTPQRPLKRAYERNPEAIDRWKRIEFPRITRLAKKLKAEIHFEDETGISSEDMRGRGYSPRGTKPIRRHYGTRSSMSMASTVTRQGTLRFMVYEGALTADIFLSFLKRLVANKKRPIFLILDNIRPHHARKVSAWVKENTDKIRLFFLPSYAPELNPDECFNNLIKGRLRSKTAVSCKKELAKRVRSEARSIQRSSQLVASLFREANVAYAA
jgi:transposase